ncbi:hypothetical protein FGG08_004744 [Glutinoglossum americanum]|uniref:Uncharacterized protein n=1 Tax=Glutinoglossum americanum TaxID=1670608 RepID=A0A9P8I1P5_9PEZI|nr:hypothetical protein FGG08_004744 [Glutinoglossum americanum]
MSEPFDFDFSRLSRTIRPASAERKPQNQSLVTREEALVLQTEQQSATEAYINSLLTIDEMFPSERDSANTQNNNAGLVENQKEKREDKKKSNSEGKRKRRGGKREREFKTLKKQISKMNREVGRVGKMVEKELTAKNKSPDIIKRMVATAEEAGLMVFGLARI